MSYYENKLESLKRILGTNDLILADDRLTVEGTSYPIIDDVIVLLTESQYPKYVRDRLGIETSHDHSSAEFSSDVQSSFGHEWRKFDQILPEHTKEFEQYFDVVDLSDLAQNDVCDLGCGSGRWACLLTPYCREITLVDFSEAIFVARRNMAKHKNAIFFMGDLKKLPFFR